MVAIELERLLDRIIRLRRELDEEHRLNLVALGRLPATDADLSASLLRLRGER